MTDPVLRSPRGNLLATYSKMPSTRAHDRPTVLVELYIKWYELYVVHPDGRIEATDGFGPVDDAASADKYKFGSGFVDHVPNPHYVQAWARSKHYWVDECSLELMVGRWMTEVLDSNGAGLHI